MALAGGVVTYGTILVRSTAVCRVAALIRSNFIVDLLACLPP